MPADGLLPPTKLPKPPKSCIVGDGVRAVNSSVEAIEDSIFLDACRIAHRRLRADL